MIKECVYKEVSHDGYGTNWKSSCGKTFRYESPIDVGWSRDPLPTEGGKFCRNCGEEIKLHGESK